MNAKQRIVVIVALVVIAAVLASTMLEWSAGTFGSTKIFVFYSKPNPEYRSIADHWGIYTAYGVTGILAGLVAPLILLSVAAFVAFMTNRTS
jgi:hypothetical protein